MQHIPSHLPIFSLSGASSEQLNCFHEQVLTRLAERGLLMATVRLESHDCQVKKGRRDYSCIDLDDTWRRYIWRGDEVGLGFMMRGLACEVDLVLLENGPDSRLGSIILQQLGDGGERLQLVDFEKDPDDAEALILSCMAGQLSRRPVWACILIGGRSSRMGRPKHLLSGSSGATWVEKIVNIVGPLVDGVALSGGGEVPDTLARLPRLADIPTVGGPLTGILSAMRWQPEVAWLLVACDMPGLNTEAVQWLLAQRTPGCWGVVPRISPASAVEPLFARYEPQCADLFERLSIQGIRRISRIAEEKRVQIVQVPESLSSGWQNINTPEELIRFNR